MSQIARKSLVATCVLAVCTLVLTPAVAQQSPVPQGLPVNVENTPNVNVTNTPTVTLSSGASVNITSPLDGSGNPTPIATLEAVQVYGSTCNFDFNDGESGSCEFTAVPQGKQLVVQEFDASGSVEAGNRPVTIAIYGTVSQINVFPYTLMLSAGGNDYLATHQETRVYAISGASPICLVDLLQVSHGSYGCQISGFLVDVPLGSSPIVAPPSQHKFPALLHGRNSGAR